MAVAEYEPDGLVDGLVSITYRYVHELSLHPHVHVLLFVGVVSLASPVSEGGVVSRI